MGLPKLDSSPTLMQYLKSNPIKNIPNLEEKLGLVKKSSPRLLLETSESFNTPRLNESSNDFLPTPIQSEEENSVSLKDSGKFSMPPLALSVLNKNFLEKIKNSPNSTPRSTRDLDTTPRSRREYSEFPEALPSEEDLLRFGIRKTPRSSRRDYSEDVNTEIQSEEVATTLPPPLMSGGINKQMIERLTPKGTKIIDYEFPEPLPSEDDQNIIGSEIVESVKSNHSGRKKKRDSILPAPIESEEDLTELKTFEAREDFPEPFNSDEDLTEINSVDVNVPPPRIILKRDSSFLPDPIQSEESVSAPLENKSLTPKTKAKRDSDFLPDPIHTEESVSAPLNKSLTPKTKMKRDLEPIKSEHEESSSPNFSHSSGKLSKESSRSSPLKPKRNTKEKSDSLTQVPFSEDELLKSGISGELVRILSHPKVNKKSREIRESLPPEPPQSEDGDLQSEEQLPPPLMSNNREGFSSRNGKQEKRESLLPDPLQSEEVDDDELPPPLMKGSNKELLEIYSPRYRPREEEFPNPVDSEDGDNDFVPPPPLSQRTSHRKSYKEENYPNDINSYNSQEDDN